MYGRGKKLSKLKPQIIRHLFLLIMKKKEIKNRIIQRDLDTFRKRKRRKKKKKLGEKKAVTLAFCRIQ